jgi:hypothetical protein
MLEAMANTDMTHFFTGNGPLCGIRMARRLSVATSRTTCPECRALLEEQERADAERSAPAVHVLGRMRRA